MWGGASRALYLALCKEKANVRCVGIYEVNALPFTAWQENPASLLRCQRRDQRVRLGRAGKREWGKLGMGRMQTYHVLQQNKCYPLIVDGDTCWVGGMRIR